MKNEFMETDDKIIAVLVSAVAASGCGAFQVKSSVRKVTECRQPDRCAFHPRAG